MLEEDDRVREGLRSWCSETNIPEYTPAMQDNDSAMTAAAASRRLAAFSLGRKATADPPAKVKRSGISTASVLSGLAAGDFDGKWIKDHSRRYLIPTWSRRPAEGRSHSGSVQAYREDGLGWCPAGARTREWTRKRWKLTPERMRLSDPLVNGK